MKKTNRLLAAFGGIAAIALTAPSALAQTPEEFFKGKTVTVYIGFGPGGTYDLFGRMVARHIGKHIPGNPNVIGSNMPGAGSFTATNWLYRVAPKDGTALGIVAQTIAMEEKLKNKAVQYKTSEFNWVGRVTSNIEVHVISTKSKGATIEGAKTVEVPVASTGPGSPSDSYPKLMNAVIGTKFKVIRGFTGSTSGLLAVERGEQQQQAYFFLVHESVGSGVDGKGDFKVVRKSPLFLQCSAWRAMRVCLGLSRHFGVH